ncbi:hypothetical protein Ahy_B08g089203 [Arachis hypogaea]|uniref:Peptidase A2 domain-containing protein n=1 Tax=Arachis hypogaea TaxID=3818 RepID=A0A444XX00_ARAHY|nr:hypothetical protein Ahy_B08g089203 [Arachis hypogaea]
MSHLRPLHVIAILNGFKINNVLIDGGAIISLLPERILEKVGKHLDDLVPTNIAVTDFSGTSTPARCYLTSEGLSVKLRYPDVGFEPTVEFSNFSTSCNETNDVSRTADLISEAHCVENKNILPLLDHEKLEQKWHGKFLHQISHEKLGWVEQLRDNFLY